MNCNLIYKNGTVSNPDMLQIPVGIDEIIELTKNNLIINQQNLEEIVSFYLHKRPDDTSYQLSSRDTWSLVTLPIISSNPLLTDRSNYVLNIATILFLIRVNHFAEVSSKILNKKIKFQIASEIKALSHIYDIPKNKVLLGVRTIDNLLKELKLNNIEVFHFDIEKALKETKRNDEIKFYKTFLLNQFSQNIPMHLSLYLSNIIDKEQFDKFDLSKSNYNKEVINLKKVAITQSKLWANIRKMIDWDQPPFNNTLKFSIRPGSKRINFIPICVNNNNQIMAPSICCVGIRRDRTIFTAPKASLLLNPKRWVELVNHYGSFFMEKNLL